MWAFAYALLALLEPGSFNVTPNEGRGDFLVFHYYSIVTLTTLGYGDVTPLTEVARAISALEALVGQLYLVVVMAWLVGMHVSRKSG